MKKIISVLLINLILISFCFPSYGAGLFEDLANYGGNVLNIPASHPRLLFDKSDIPQIITNSKNAENKKALEALNSALLLTTNNVLDENSSSNADNSVLFAIQAKAFNHIVFGGDTGEDAVESIIDYLNKFRYPEHDFSAMQSYHQVTYTMYIASLVYDWCYDILTQEQEKAIRLKLLSLAESENQFNSLVNGLSPFGGTGTSNYIMRDFLSVGVALYETNPEILNYIYTKLNNTYKPIIEFFGQAKSSFYGYQYGAFAMYGQTMAYRILESLNMNTIFSQSFFDELDYYITCRLPDGNALCEGDDYLRAKGEYNLPMDDAALSLISASAFHFTKNLKYKSYLKDLSLTHTAFWYGTICYTPIDSILLVDTSATVSEYKVPRNSYYPSPMGMTIVSDGENKEKAVVRMKIGEGYKWHHQHYDAGSFEIYYKGRLTGQSAQYSRTDIDQYSNYYVQSVASNTLLIKDPDEVFTYWNNFDEAENSGGQRVKRTGATDLEDWKSKEYYTTGKILGHKETDSFSYLSGDITNAYSDKVSEVKRSMVYVSKEEQGKAGIMFIVDKINSADKGFKKTFLLHAPSKPDIIGNTAVISRTDNDCNGRLTLKSVYPETEITPVGGEEMQWYVNGTNYAPLSSYAPALSSDPLAYGWGRLEVSPKEERNLDYFVNVLYIDDADAEAAPEVNCVENDYLIGAETDGETVLYLKSEERQTDNFSFSLKKASNVKLLNINEGYWNIYNGDSLIATEYVDDESGMVYFSSDSGEITLEYVSDSCFSGGLGTESVPYLISTPEDFYNIGKSADNDEVFYKQLNDISLGNYTPFEFNGNYNGNGKKLDVNIESDSDYIGLFSALYGNAEVKGLTVTGKITGNSFVGGIAGRIYSAENVSVYNCKNYADITADVKAAGGFIGESYYDSKINSATVSVYSLENYGTINSPLWAAGITGVTKISHKMMLNNGKVISASTAGGITGLTYSSISESANNGYISGNPAGGISGHLIVGSVTECFNSGTVEIDYFKTTGGIVGTSDRGTIKYCYDSGYLNTPEKQIVGKIDKKYSDSSVTSCYYLNPSGNKGISGTYPLNMNQLKSFSISSAFEKSQTSYPYPQLKNTAKVTEYTKLLKITVNSENTVVYPASGINYIKRNSDVKFWVYPCEYYKLSTISYNGSNLEFTKDNIYSVGNIMSDSTLEVKSVAKKPENGDTLVYDGSFNEKELVIKIPDYFNTSSYACILYSSASGIFSDCGFSVSSDGVNYKDYTTYKSDVTEHTFGVFFTSKNPGKYYIKPYVKDKQGRVYYGQQTEVQLMSLGK